MSSNYQNRTPFVPRAGLRLFWVHMATKVIQLMTRTSYERIKFWFGFRMKSQYPTKWISWIESFVLGGNVSIEVNDDIRHFLQTKKGLRQGDPLSPMFFNIVANMMVTLINWAKVDGQICGVVPHLVDDGISILHYADDTIRFMKHDLEKARNMKLLLCAFEHLSGLKINFHKSELFYFGDARTMEDQYTKLFGCSSGEFPLCYFPIHYRKLRNNDWKWVEEHYEKRLGSWKGKLLSTGRRLTLINSVLSSLPLYMMFFFAISRCVLKKLDCFRSRFYWQCDDQKKKCHLMKWSIMCRPKEQRGFRNSWFIYEKHCPS